MRRKPKWPAEALLFEDKDQDYTGDYYEAMEAPFQFLMQCRRHWQHEDSWMTTERSTVDADFAVPLTPAAREFLKIVRGK